MFKPKYPSVLCKNELGCWNTLDKTVCNHVPSRNEVRIEHSIFYFVPEPVEAKIQVFHATIMGFSGFLDTVIALWLFILRVEDCSTPYPNSERMFLIHAISFPASTAAMYSASVVERAIVCNLLYHPTAPPAIIVTYPAVERPVSTQSLWEASE